MDRDYKQASVHTDDTRAGVSVHGDVQGARFEQPHDHPKRNIGYKRNRYYKYLLAVGLSAFLPSQALAETIGGVSATASPVANSSGSVTNQAIQVLQGFLHHQHLHGGIQCQGPTRNFTPYVDR